MSSPFVSRRKPKRLGRDTEDAAVEDEDLGPVVRKPAQKNAPKNQSKLRMSFGPGQTDPDHDPNDDLTSKSKSTRTKLAKEATTRTPSQRQWDSLTPSDRGDQESDRPTYSKDYLTELRNSTPSTPLDLSSHNSEDDEGSKEIDIASRFGVFHKDPSPSFIPTEAEIREKKERRARLAKEQDYISLHDDGDGRELQLSSRKEGKDSRLVREDEDMAEGFDDFVEDAGRVALGKKAKAVQRKHEREAVKNMIAAAENDTEEDDSDAEQNLAYETAQTRSGMDGLGFREKKGDGFRAPTIITPIPRLSTVLERFRSKIMELEYNKAKLSKQMADLQQEKVAISTRETDIQQLVKEAGERYEQLRLESQSEKNGEPDSNHVPIQRGLEALGNT